MNADQPLIREIEDKTAFLALMMRHWARIA